MRKTLLIAILPVFVLAACGGGGPSKGDVKAALIEQVEAANSFLGTNTETPDIEILDMNCSETGENTYSCEVLAEVNGTELSDTMRMTKLGGKWRIKQ